VMAILFVLTPITFFNNGSLSCPCINWYCFKPCESFFKIVWKICNEEHKMFLNYCWAIDFGSASKTSGNAYLFYLDNMWNKRTAANWVCPNVGKVKFRVAKSLKDNCLTWITSIFIDKNL
jgi:hypothetical protein